VTASVYIVCMARVNIYLPDDLAKRAREAGLNVSGIAQESLERKLRILATDQWLDGLRDRPRGPDIPRKELEQLMDEVREESGRAADKHLDDPDRTYP
jgi:post-segregation antitoxin (ccd killing protein)